MEATITDPHCKRASAPVDQLARCLDRDMLQCQIAVNRARDLSIATCSNADMGSETWRYWVLAALTFGCVSCEDDPCQEVATLLRACCARGPAELRASCQSDANLLEQDGNSDACEKALNRGTYAVCQP